MDDDDDDDDVSFDILPLQHMTTLSMCQGKAFCSTVSRDAPRRGASQCRPQAEVGGSALQAETARLGLKD